MTPTPRSAASTHRTERARLAQLADDRARSGFFIRDQHDLRGERTDGDHAAHDAAAVTTGMLTAMPDVLPRLIVIVLNQTDGSRAITRAGTDLDFALFLEIEQCFETVVFSLLPGGRC